MLWRKRIARHIDSCDTCTERRRIAVGMAALAPAFAAPAWLRERTLGARPRRRRASLRATGSTTTAFQSLGADRHCSVPAPRWRQQSPSSSAWQSPLPLLGNNDPDIVASIDAGPTTTISADDEPERGPDDRADDPDDRPSWRPATGAAHVTVDHDDHRHDDHDRRTTTTTTPPPNQPTEVSRAADQPRRPRAAVPVAGPPPPRTVAVSAAATDDSAHPVGVGVVVRARWQRLGHDVRKHELHGLVQCRPARARRLLRRQSPPVDDDGATASASASFTITAC